MKIKTIYILLFWATGILLVFACKKSDSTPDAPAVKSPQWLMARGLEGKAIWDSTAKVLKITSNVSFGLDNDIETFHWQVPKDIKTIVIGANVTVTGGFRVDHGMTIKGEDRNTSVIFGTNTTSWASGPDKTNSSPNCNVAAGDDRAADCAKWRYSAIMADKLAATDTLFVKTLTIKNARCYNITSFNSRIFADNLYLYDARGGTHNNCDGFGAGGGSAISNSTIEVTDDAIKLYKDMKVTNVTIKLRRNGAPFQLGWGGETSNTATLKNVLVVGIDPENRYNCGLFSWKSDGANTTRTISIDGLKTSNFENAFIWGGQDWVQHPVFEVNGGQAKVIVTATNTAISHAQANSTGKGIYTLDICGVATAQKSYTCGTGNTTTGN